MMALAVAEIQDIEQSVLQSPEIVRLHLGRLHLLIA